MRKTAQEEAARVDVRRGGRTTPFAAAPGSPSLPGSFEAPRRRSVGRKTVLSTNKTQRTSLDDDELAGGECFPPDVEVDNNLDERYTVLTLKVKDFPGLLRLVAWILGGMRARVRKADLHTDDAGFAQNVFYLTDLKGCKLKSADAELIRETITDHVAYCQPDFEFSAQVEAMEEGNCKLDNTVDNECTVVTLHNADRVGFLLEVASVMTGLGLYIRSASISETARPERGADNIPTRDFKFKVVDLDGEKLDYVKASGLLFTLSLVGDGRTSRLAPPT